MFLGFIINSVTMTIKLTEEKARKLESLCKSLRCNPRPTVRVTAQTIGTIISSFPGTRFGPLYFRALERDKTKALKLNKGNFDSNMILSTNAKLDVDWWINNVSTCYGIITRTEPDCILTTDACTEGWGAVYENRSTRGLWTAEEKTHHINYLELLGVFLGMKTFLSLFKSKHVRLMVDNSTSVAVINNMGTSHSKTLNTLCKNIWEWAISRDLWLSAAHIAGKLNTQADFESRDNRSAHEWKLNPPMLKRALRDLDVMPEIDLFASRINNQFERYVSYRPDPGAFAIDALSLSWTNLDFYAFPSN